MPHDRKNRAHCLCDFGVIQCSCLIFLSGVQKGERGWRVYCLGKSKQYPEIHDFVKYLVYWVAGAKLVFLLLLAVIVFFGDLNLQRQSLIALAAATMTFFWRLFPLIRKMDRNEQVTPRNYSVILGGMIIGLVAIFVVGALT